MTTDVRRGTSGTSRDVPIFVQFLNKFVLSMKMREKKKVAKREREIFLALFCLFQVETAKTILCYIFFSYLVFGNIQIFRYLYKYLPLTEICLNYFVVI